MERGGEITGHSISNAGNMSSPSDPQSEQTQNSHLTQNEEQIQNPQQQPEQQLHSETLDTPKPLGIDIDQPQEQHQKQEESLAFVDLKENEEDEPEQGEQGQQQGSGMSIEPITIPDADPQAINTPITSPTNPNRRYNKRKKGGRNFMKRKLAAKIVETLTGTLVPVPFVPTKIFDFGKHEEILKRLGLWDFVHIEFDRTIRVDLVAQLIANYDRGKRCSYVNELRINVNRPDLGRSLKLPAIKLDKGSVDEVDLDSEAFSDESVAFLDEFVSTWLLLHDDTWVMPHEVSSWTRVIKDGHPEKMDWAGLVWYMVEKELVQGDKLRGCFYASHLQHLIKSQKEGLFKEESKVAVEVKDMEEDNGAVEVKDLEEGSGAVEVKDLEEDDGAVEVKDLEEDDGAVEVKDLEEDDGAVEVKDLEEDDDAVEVKDMEEDDGAVEVKDLEEDDGAVEVKELEEDDGAVEVKDREEDDATLEVEDTGLGDGPDGNVKGDDDVACVNVKGETVGAEANMMGEEHALSEETNIQLTLGQDAEEEEKVKKDDVMDYEKYKEEEEEVEMVEGQGNWLLDGKNNLGDHFLQRCGGNDVNSYEDIQQEEGDEEEEEESMEEEGEEEEARGVGYDIEANDSLDRDDLTGNLLQGMETAQIPFNSQGEIRDMSSVDIFASRGGTYMMSTLPSFFGNGSKRAIEPDQDTSHHCLDGPNKRLRTDDMWDQKPSDLGTCLENMQQLLTKTRMICESKEQSFEHARMEQQFLVNQVHEQQSVIQFLQKSKTDELEKKNAEIFRLERELYLMGDLLAGYRNALKQTQKAFSEYRELHPHPEEPLYRDAGPGGVVLSIRELEKLRLKHQEEDNAKLLILLKHNVDKFELEWADKFEAHLGSISLLESKLVNIEDVVNQMKELSAAQKNFQRSPDATLEDDIGFQSLHANATESQDNIGAGVGDNSSSKGAEILIQEVTE